ncbi:hypothetical protein SAMN05446935_8323 [Burkholderia sp. YR290]|nr:hypothetical protein SAMN05446935_8323 [Burkholderia sp. YR290]
MAQHMWISAAPGPRPGASQYRTDNADSWTFATITTRNSHAISVMSRRSSHCSVAACLTTFSASDLRHGNRL